jgi:nucleoid-associated protein YgaU
MNNIIPLPQIISQLAQLTDCDVATARKFLHEFFATIESVLMTGESIQIKGVGTFSKSDNPNEPIVFVPDEELADAINTPFAMFEAIPLDDDIDEAVLNEQIPAPQEQATVVDEPTTVSANDDAAETQEEQPQEELSTEAEPSDEEPSEVAEQEAVEQETVEEEAVEEVEATTIPESAPTEEPEVITAVEPDEDEDATVQQSNNGAVKLIIAFVIGLICGFLIHYLIDFGFTPTDDATIETDSIPEIEQIDIVDTVVKVIDTVTPAKVDTPAKPDTTTSKVQQVKEPEPIYDTITNKRFLTSMAKQYYGRKDYWVYIYRANLDIIGNPNMITAGTKVRIPRREEFATGKTEKETIDKAHELAAEIYAKYK